MSTRNIVKNIRSSEVVGGKPKLPTSNQLDFGEIAINYAKDYETLSFKNNSGDIVSLSVKTVDDVTVNGNSVVSNKTANITMKGRECMKSEKEKMINGEIYQPFCEELEQDRFRAKERCLKYNSLHADFSYKQKRKALKSPFHCLCQCFGNSLFCCE